MKPDEIISAYGNTIRKSQLFNGMEDNILAECLEITEAAVSEYKKGGFLHCAFERLNRFGLVLSGTVQACSDDIEGNRMIMAEVTPGLTFGEALCYLKIPDSPVYIVAPERCTVLWLSTDMLYRSDKPAAIIFERQFTSVLAARTLAMNGRIQILSKLKLRDKLITYFSELSSSSGSDTFKVTLNRESMAAYIGTDRSALCRELSSMKKDGIIDYRKNTFRLIGRN